MNTTDLQADLINLKEEDWIDEGINGVRCIYCFEYQDRIENPMKHIEEHYNEQGNASAWACNDKISMKGGDK